MFRKPKMLTGFNQKGEWPGCRSTSYRIANVAPPVKWKSLTHFVCYVEHGNPVAVLITGKHAVKFADTAAGVGGWKKRMHCCNRNDTDLNVIRHESEPTSNWS